MSASGKKKRKKTTRKKSTAKKPASKRKTARSGSKRRKKPSPWTASGRTSSARSLRRRVFKAAALAALVLTLGVVGYGLVLDARIKDRFVGQPWEQPARVYAKPLELYVGASVSADELVTHLEELGYQRVAQPSRSGEFARAGAQVRLVSRAHALTQSTAQALDVMFSGATVLRVLDANGAPVPLATLEPAVLGSILARSGVDRTVVGDSEVPELLKQALIAVEDRRFLDHHGLDFRGIARAAWVNVRAGRVRQGGSTLTQQLIKSHFLTNEQTWRRKFKEALMAISIDARMDKEDILLAYINEIYLGQDGARSIHGFDLASRFYFARRLHELDIHEIATLTGIVRGPSQYNPRRHPQAALQRRNQVLELMREQRIISDEAARTAASRPLGIVTDRTGHIGGYPTVLSLVRRQLLTDYDVDELTSLGLSVFTSLDVIAQRRVEASVAEALAQVEAGLPEALRPLQTAAAVVAPDTGDLIALVGGRQAGFDGFNRAVDMQRPVGSLIKPFVFLAALESGRYDLDAPLSNEPVEVTLDNGQIWSPRNYSQTYGGNVPMFKALTDSLNVPTVHLGMDIGVSAVVDTLKRLGLDRPVEAYPSLLLGATALSPLEVTRLYLGLAGRGFVTEPRVVTDVKNASGQPLTRYPVEVGQAASTDSAYQIVETLRLATTHGTARSLPMRLPGTQVAGKTGSTNDLRDSWFAGVTQSAVAVVWVGRDDNAPMTLTGARGALPVWAAIMRALRPVSLWQSAPESMLAAPFDYVSGQPLTHCQDSVLIPLRAGASRASAIDCR